MAKGGWEYLRVRCSDAESEKVLVKQPIAVFVEKVYESGDLSGLGIGVYPDVQMVADADPRD